MKTCTGAISKLSWCMKVPVRVLCRARDLYVNSMIAYAGRVPSSLPKSFSVCSARPSEGEDLQKLIRVASHRRQKKQENMGEQLQQVAPSSIIRRSNGRLPKSLSVGMGRIDEDKPCDFAEDFSVFYPRVGGYAVANRKTRVQYSC